MFAATGLSACGGGPEALSEEDAKAALLTEENFPLDGYKASKSEDSSDEESGDSDEQTFEDFIFMFEDVSDECKDAGKAMDDLGPSNEDDNSTATFKKGDKVAEVSLSPGAEEFGKRIDAVEKLADDCGELSGGPYGMKMAFEKLENEDARGIKMKIGAMGETQTMTLAAAEVGENTVAVNGEQVSEEDVLKVLDAQKKAVEDK
ncbi:hypothetical protein [Kytococcus sp. Marseille-QA3725]